MLINIKKKTNNFDYFFQRFENGQCIAPHLPKITTEESAKNFQPRDNGLKILLINPSIREWSYPNIEPLGLCYISSVAIMDGHQVFPLDLNAERQKPIENLENWQKYCLNRINEEINKVRPDVIGIGGIITQYKNIKELVSYCKDIAPKIPIVLGGGIFSCASEFMLKYLPIDYGIYGEGEITFSEFLYRLENKLSMENCLGLGYINTNKDIIINLERPSAIDGELGLDCFPWPLRHIWSVENVYKINPTGHLNFKTKWTSGELAAEYKGKYSLSLLGTRGCVYGNKACDFCYVAYLGKNYRKRTVANITDEMEYLKSKYNLSYLHFLDDLFETEWKWSLDFFEELRKRKKTNNFEIEWGATCRGNIIADDILRAQKQNRSHMMEQAFEVGQRQVAMGVESCSDKILKLIDKSGLTQEKIKISLREVKRIFGYCDPSLMVGNPGETEETIKETVRVMKEVNADTETVFYTTAFPSTELFNLANEKGLIHKAVYGVVGETTDDVLEKYFLLLGENSEKVRTNFSDELSDEELEKWGEWMTNELQSINKRHPTLLREPHSGDISKPKNANKADL